MSDSSAAPSPVPPIAVPRLAFPALVGGNVALAFGPWLVRLADTGPVAAGFWRLLLGLPVLTLFALLRRQKASTLSAGGWALLLFSGLFFAADLASWHYGILRTKLANSTLFGNSSSLLLPLWSIFIARRLPRASQTIALVLAFGGALLMMGNSYQIAPQTLVGDLSCVVAGIFYTGYLLLLQKVRQGLGSWSVLALSTAASTAPMLIFALALGERIVPHDWTPLLILAMTSQIVGQGLLVYAIAYFSPLVVGLVLLTQPAVAAVVGWIVFGERLTPTDAVGAVAVALALVLVQLPGRERRLPAADEAVE